MWVGLGVAAVLVVVVAQLMRVQPDLPGRHGADPFTGLLSLVATVIARLAGLATLGFLAAVIAFRPIAFLSGQVPADEIHGESDLISDADRRLTHWAAAFAQVWWIASLVLTFANPTFLTGVPVSDSLRPQAWWIFITSTPSALAWLVSAAVALATAWSVNRARHISTLVLAWLVGLVATVFVAVTGNVSVGADHDWATDAMAVSTVAFTVLASGAIGAVLAASWVTRVQTAGLDSNPAGAVSDPPRALDHDVTRRYQHAAAPLIVVIAAGWWLIAWQQLAGRPLLDSAYGLVVVGQGVVVMLLALSWLIRAAAHRGVSSVVPDIVLVLLGVVMLVAAEHLPPPRFLVPQTIQENFLGYDVTTPPTIVRLLTPGRPNLLWVVLSVLALGLYAWGVMRVRRRGMLWPAGRIISWVLGWAFMLFLATSGLWEFSTAAFSWHMLVHMSVNMMVPLLCVLGAPFALVTAASGSEGARRTSLATPTALLHDLGRHKVVKVLLSPPVLWAVYVGSLYAVYFSPLFPWLMRYHWGHQAMLLHFMITGFAFFHLLVGPDQGPGRVPHLIRFALLVSIMPFHAIFAVGIMSATSVLGGQFYRALATPWVPDLLADQNTAGQITWFTGEIPAFIAVLVLAYQWFRTDSSEASAADQILDAGTDSGEDELAAYNQMFAELADRDRREEAAHPRSGGGR